VDEVEEDRPGALFPPPGHIEIVVRLEEPADPVDGENLAQTPGIDRAFGSLDHRVVPSMMADEQRHAGPFGRFYQRCRGCDVVGNGLFHQCRDASRNCFQTILNVDLIGRRDDHAVRLVLGKHIAQAREPSRAMPARGGLTFGRRIDHSGEVGHGLCIDMLDVPSADQPGAEHRKANGRRHGCFPRSAAWSMRRARRCTASE
jgi:hypothetical protein